MANPPQNSPSLGVTDAPGQRAPHREARNHHPLILKSLNWAQQRPRFLFDPPYDPLGQKEQQKLVSQAGKSSRYPLKSAAGRHPGKPECPPPLGSLGLKCLSLSCVWLFVTPWSVQGILQARYWSGLVFPSPGNLPNRGIKPGSLALQTDYLPSELPGKPLGLKRSV